MLPRELICKLYIIELQYGNYPGPADMYIVVPAKVTCLDVTRSGCESAIGWLTGNLRKSMTTNVGRVDK